MALATDARETDVAAELSRQGMRPLSCITAASTRLLNLRHLYAPQEEEDVIEALHMGLVIAAMNVPDRFFNYRCGVFCSDPTDITIGRHAVEIVDFGTTSSGIDFWVAKNSWGDDWGEDGYFRIRRGDLIFAHVVLVLSISHPVSTPTTNYTTCAPETVSNASQHPLFPG